jgi:hypothetical protein
VGLFIGVPVVAPAIAVSCTAAQITSGTCSVGGGTTGDGVDLWGNASWGGTDPGDSDGGPDECPIVVNGQCEGSSPPKGGSGPTTVRDLESFRPRSPQQFVEPDGWSIRHVPTNFWSNAAIHVVSGQLLGNPAHVRFTPVLYRRYFGDGQRNTSTHRGASLRELGQSPWTRTATSHSYNDAGNYRVRLVVWYTAEFRFGNQDWRDLDGMVTTNGNDIQLVVVSTDTVLVARQCRAGAIGCAA